MIVFGLILDIIGAAIIIRAELTSHAAILRQSPSSVDGESFKRFTFWLAKKFGSRNPLDTQNYVVESFFAKFWGFVLLLLGFIFQAIGVFT